MHFAPQYCTSGDVMAIHGFHRVVVTANIGAIQGKACKGALGARVRQDLGIQLPIRIGRSVAPNRTSRGRSISTQFEVARSRRCIPRSSWIIMTRSIPSIPICRSPASAGNRKERGRAPTVCRPAGGNATAVFRAKNKSALKQMRNHGNTLRMLQDFFRDSLVRSFHDLVQHSGCVVQALG